MKKLKLFGIILASALFITACSCSKTKEYTITFDSNGGTTVSSQKGLHMKAILLMDGNLMV